MVRQPRRSHTRMVAAIAVATLFPLAASAASGSAPDPGVRRVSEVGTAGVAQLVRVAAPTPADRSRVAALGLDTTEAAGADWIDVVLHGSADRGRLKAAGFSWTVRVPDLGAQDVANASADAKYAAAAGPSPLPSGHRSYRHLRAINDELSALAKRYPGKARLITLPRRTLLGQKVYGIELSHDVARTRDGKPVMLMLGAHHTREWPSAEHTLEFAYDLLKNDGRDARATAVLDASRVILVPVVNPDGYRVSRNATPIGDFSLFDYEMKRKNCAVSISTPAAYLGGTCADNPAGRLRGTDLNRNYPGFWGGPGASTTWSDDDFRGDGPGSEPEVANIRDLVSTRQVTGLITNHTYSNLVLRPPSIAATGLAPDEGVYRALGAEMTAANGYTNWASFQLYDTSGGTEDWSYWVTGGLGYTFEIGPDGFHPPYADAVVAEYLGLPPAAGAGRGGNREAYYRFAMANLDPANHATITGRAGPGRIVSVSKRFTTGTSPVVQPDGTVGDPIPFEDHLRSAYASTGGRFTLAVNPSTRPLVLGRGGRDPQGPAQPSVALVNPPGVPAEGGEETAGFVIEGPPAYDNGKATITVGWPDSSVDWDVYVLNDAGELVASAASLDDPEVALMFDPVPGTYSVVVQNYAGGTVASDWTGSVTFAQPTPAYDSGVREAWTVTCRTSAGRVLGSQLVIVGRGQSRDVGDPCVRPTGAGAKGRL